MFRVLNLLSLFDALKTMNTKPNIKIAIADDHTIFREGFVALMQQAGFISITFEAGNAHEVFENLKYTLPDILLLDIQMPDTTGTQTLEKVKELYPDIKVIILSSFDEGSLILEFIKKGSSAFLSKTCGRDLLLKTIETVYETGLYYDDRIMSLLSGKSGGDISSDSNKEKMYLDQFTSLIKEFNSPLKTIDEYCKELSLNEKQLYIICKKHLNQSPKQIIEEYFVELIKQALLNKEKRIQEIAFDFGFDDTSYFTRFFKKHTELTPKMYRTKFDISA